MVLSNTTNARQINEPSFTSLKKVTDRWEKDIRSALIVFRGLNTTQKEKMRALDRIIITLHVCGQKVAKNGELSVEVQKAINLASQQAAYCENRAANPAEREYAEAYRRGAQTCRQRAESMKILMKNIHDKHDRFMGLMLDFQKHKRFYFDMLVIGEISLAARHLAQVSKSMDEVIKELQKLGQLKLQQAQVPVRVNN